MKRRTRSSLRRTVAVGGAVVCIAVGYEASTPTGNALSIVIPIGDGTSNFIQVNIFEGNIFRTQLGIGSGNVSNLSTIADVAMGNGNSHMTDASLGSPVVLGAATGNGNVIQVNLFSFNIYNPQVSFGGSNVSNNTTISNVSTGNGNNSRAEGESSNSFLAPWMSGMTGNGNSTQLSFFSGNIFNPQWAFGGANVSNNIAATNIAAYNGNNSESRAASGAFLGLSLLALMGGNGNTTQVAGATSNIYNTQFSIGGGNQSFNTATTNDSTGNGNTSDNGVSPLGGLGVAAIFGTTGSGNTNQIANGASNIFNEQFHFSLGLPIGAAPALSAADATGSVGPEGSTSAPAMSVGGAGSVGVAGFGSDDSSVRVASSASSYSESSSSPTRFTAYGGDTGDHPVDPTDRSADPGGRFNSSTNRLADSDDRSADSDDRNADSGNSPANSGGKGESGAKGDQ